VDARWSTTHFYGTLNLQTGQEIMTRSDTMNSDATAQHLQALLDAYPDQPILLLWDRAPWHQGAAVRPVLADNPRLEIHALPDRVARPQPAGAGVESHPAGGQPQSHRAALAHVG
jgi:hypothetical protein